MSDDARYCTCEPCPDDTYMDVENSATECKTCAVINSCDSGHYKTACTSTQNADCAVCTTTCPSAYYDLSDCGAGVDAKCSECPLPDGKDTYCNAGYYFKDPFGGKYSS